MEKFLTQYRNSRVHDREYDISLGTQLDFIKIRPKLAKKKKNPDKPSPSQTFEKFLDLVSFLLHKKFREEFIGDLKETRLEMQKRGHSKWSINTISFFKVCSVIWSALRIRLSDLFESEKENNK